jgi:steroid delta-isomerase-like uncharacterized protein
MSSKNVRTLEGIIAAFNANKDIEAIGAAYADQCVLVDHARGETVKGRAAVKENWSMWATAFPDGTIEEARWVDGGETVALYFVGRGTNTGAVGPMPATGKRVALPYCSVFVFDARDKIVEQEDYWDQYGFLTQLGHIPAPK